VLDGVWQRLLARRGLSEVNNEIALSSVAPVIRVLAEIPFRGAYLVIRAPRADQTRDEELVRRCQAKDLSAFNAIVARYQDRVYSFVRRMVRDASDAEDIAQEVFVRVYQGMDRFDRRASLSTWLFRIAANMCVDYSRRRSRRVDPVPLTREGEDGEHEVELPDRRYDPERLVLTGEMYAVVEAAISRLSGKLRAVLLLHDAESLSYEEIAEIVKVPLGTVKSRLFLAREQLRHALRDYMAGAR
jgi:RNA polymerase sigma-70 factor (ECF subfamily)